MSFKSLGLLSELLKAVDKQGYTSPSPIQEKTIPTILKGADVLASAQTGTGKNSRFYLADVAKFSSNEKRKIQTYSSIGTHTHQRISSTGI